MEKQKSPKIKACITEEFACITRRLCMIYQKSQREIPEQLATITSKEHHGDDHGDKRSYTAGLQKVGTAGTAGAGQITFGWTK